MCGSRLACRLSTIYHLAPVAATPARVRYLAAGCDTSAVRSSHVGSTVAVAPFPRRAGRTAARREDAVRLPEKRLIDHLTVYQRGARATLGGRRRHHRQCPGHRGRRRLDSPVQRLEVVRMDGELAGEAHRVRAPRLVLDPPLAAVAGPGAG